MSNDEYRGNFCPSAPVDDPFDRGDEPEPYCRPMCVYQTKRRGQPSPLDVAGVCTSCGGTPEQHDETDPRRRPR